MFSKHPPVAYFGTWAEERSDAHDKKAALAILRAAVERCFDDDARTADVCAALEYLAARITRPAATVRFRNALDLPDPTQRFIKTMDAYNSIVRDVGQGAF